MTSPDTPKTVSNLTMAPRKPKPSAIAEASEPEIVGLKKPSIPEASAQARARALAKVRGVGGDGLVVAPQTETLPAGDAGIGE